MPHRQALAGYNSPMSRVLRAYRAVFGAMTGIRRGAGDQRGFVQARISPITG